MKDWFIHSSDDLAELVTEYGFLPFSANRIPGFSAEEHTPSYLWFADGVEGPWEWKGPVIQKTGCAYGKFFPGGKAGFVSKKWYCHLANYRRNGYDFDSRCDAGMVRCQDKRIYEILQDALTRSSSVLSKDWRMMAGIADRGKFEASVTRLQMMGYVVTAGFEYETDKYGKEYGWGLSRYSTPEALYGADFTDRVYTPSPEESGGHILCQLSFCFPDTPMADLEKVLGKCGW
ncbi:MAG: hypothetical protein LUE27_09810 [Clostridia bacterium]|nr:hypothetical protein [Clostridia bacterium]